ncbi:hypothetical protein [Roseimicrobium sp. ORNL1]|uniref:hypothetical protein n=1 Tax=Roseimicrobium sp. ORNL1 TaxID=2711231 RepID=UPI0013E1B484|nr:hypothetical protein [Roseimicrobium sp. ORNL1]QIF02771.1 hypothetical protein G5S37_14995 [Roseimicrobium sp. ORNL1]
MISLHPSKNSLEGWKGQRGMTRRENVRFYIDAIARTFEEYCDSRRYHEALARRKELMLYVRQLEAHIEYLDSEIRDQYKRQTGLRAIRGLWKKLGTKVVNEDESPGGDERGTDAS